MDRAQYGDVVVGFSDRPALGLWSLLQPGFRHCFALLSIKNHWVLVDHLFTRTHIDHCSSKDVAKLIGSVSDLGTILVRGRRRVDNMAPFWLRIATCVETVKHIVGIRSAITVTPFQLYNLLVADLGFEPVSLVGDAETRSRGLTSYPR